MKKALSLLLSAVLLTAACAISTGAAAVSTDVFRGTPVIDGVLDEIYLQSASATIDNPGFHIWENYAGEFDMTATAYYLWDDNYFYCCTVVTDNDVLDIGAARYEENPLNWQSEAVENWFDEGYGKWKTHADAYGHTFFAQNVNSDPPFDYTDESECKHAATLTDTGYIVEYAFKLEDLSVGAWLLTSIQVNDQCTLNDGVGTGYASGSQNVEIELTFVADEAVAPEPEPEPEIVETVEEPEPEPEPEPVEETVEIAEAEEIMEEPAPEPTTAPQTFDPVTATAVSAVVSLLGFQLTKKRR